MTEMTRHMEICEVGSQPHSCQLSAQYLWNQLKYCLAQATICQLFEENGKKQIPRILVTTNWYYGTGKS